MKKFLMSAISFVIIMASGICAFAAPDTAAISRIEVVDYVILLGLGFFLIGMVFILVSMYAGGKKKDAKPEEDVEYDYDSEETAEELPAIEEETASAEPEQEEATEEVAEEEVPEDNSETNKDSDEAEDEPAEAEAEQTEVEPEIELEPEPESEPEPEPEPEPESEPEPEPELPKIRITLSGMNNFDVKVMEFTKTATLGRRAGNDIVISDSAVSGNHCEFTYEDEKVYVEDSHSTNGTFINDEAVEKAEIKSGDTITVGNNKYRINISL